MSMPISSDSILWLYRAFQCRFCYYSGMARPTGQTATVTEKTLGYPQSPRRGTCKAIPTGTPAHTTRATGGCTKAGQEPFSWFPQHRPVRGSPWAWSSGVVALLVWSGPGVVRTGDTGWIKGGLKDEVWTGQWAHER